MQAAERVEIKKAYASLRSKLATVTDRIQSIRDELRSLTSRDLPTQARMKVAFYCWVAEETWTKGGEFTEWLFLEQVCERILGSGRKRPSIVRWFNEIQTELGLAKRTGPIRVAPSYAATSSAAPDVVAAHGSQSSALIPISAPPASSDASQAAVAAGGRRPASHSNADLNARIRSLLGEAAEPPRNSTTDYHEGFRSSAVVKAKAILDDLLPRELDLARFAYVSIGGSTGAEIIHVLQNTDIQHGYLLEYDTDASDEARRQIPHLAAANKTLRVLTGDATQHASRCRTELLSWKEAGKIDGIVCSIQAVLHELPRRSPGFNLDHLLGELLWTWDPCLLYVREPCAPQNWPSRVRLCVPGLSSELLEALARDVHTKLGFPSPDVRRAGADFLSLPSTLAAEVLFKLFYSDTYQYEIQERLTSYSPTELVRAIEAHLGPSSVSHRLLSTRTFESHYRRLKILAQDEKSHVLPIPLTSIWLVGQRISRSPSLTSQTTDTSHVFTSLHSAVHILLANAQVREQVAQPERLAGQSGSTALTSGIAAALHLSDLSAAADNAEATGALNDTPVIRRVSATVVAPIDALLRRLRGIEPGPYSFGDNDARKQSVRFTRRLFVDPYPVTQDLYEAVCRANPSAFRGPRLPVEKVTWFDAIAFCNALSKTLGLDAAYSDGEGGALCEEALGFRLPTEAEWEYACARHSPTPDSTLDKLAWHMNNARGETRDVGQKTYNANQLYDMLGNVWEWCNDWYAPDPQLSGDDPRGPVKGYDKVCRGGSWSNTSNMVKWSYRFMKDPHLANDNIGFRIVTHTAFSSSVNRR